MKEIYDIIIIGGGPNGLGIACYLAKCGLKVCIVEERLQVGGGAENTEPIPGFRIDPHATYFYGAAGPGVEQLELHKFGFRMIYYKGMMGGVTTDGKALIFGRYCENQTKHLAKFSQRDSEIWQIFQTALQPYAVDLLRSIYWTPPPPEGIKIPTGELPWAKVFKKAIPDIYDDEWNDMSTFELVDSMLETEALKVMIGMAAWYNGPHPDWKGTGIFGLTCNMLAHYSSGSPLGGMHSYMHSLLRCALSFGAKVYTNCKVEEIIIEDGCAKGVILSDDSPVINKKLYADKAVISAVHVKDTFLNLVPSSHLNKNFLQRVQDINLKGGSLFVLSLISKELPKFKGDAGEIMSGSDYPSCIFLPVDTRQTVMNQTLDVYSLNTHPTKKESIIIPLCVHDIYDNTRCPSGHHIFSPIYLQMPPPEYHKDGPLAVNKAKDEIVNLILEVIKDVAPNLTEDKITGKFVNTPYDSSLRNLGFVAGNWYGVSEAEECWYDKRPLPELSRYRTPIDKLYLCNHTSYPGGLCLLAVPYNLMHILIEDGVAQPGEWWYPSPWYIKKTG